MDKLNVLYLSDNNYAIFAGISILSLFINNKHIPDITVYVIDDGIAEENKKKYYQIAEKYSRDIVFLDLTKGIQILEELHMPKYRNSYTTYLKLFTFDILPDDVERIFFIDSDSIIVGDLSEMIDFDLKGNVIGAVKDGLSQTYKEALGFPAGDSWYNMGIMLVDVQQWKKQQCQKLIIEQMKKRQAYIAVDQDLLNITQHGKITTLHPKYNATAHHYVYESKGFLKHLPQKGFYDAETLDEGNKDARIRHFERFVGESPWNVNSIHPYTKYFDKYLLVSPWKDFKKTKPQKNMTLKIEKILYVILPHKMFLPLFAWGFRRYLKKSNAHFEGNKDVKNIS